MYKLKFYSRQLKSQNRNHIISSSRHVAFTEKKIDMNAQWWTVEIKLVQFRRIAKILVFFIAQNKDGSRFRCFNMCHSFVLRTQFVKEQDFFRNIKIHLGN